MEIENKTPWNTEELLAFLTPLIHSSYTKLTIDNQRPQPGRKREKQRLVEVHAYYDGSPHLEINLLSPKRAKARTNALDRLSLAGSLATHEAAIPATELADIKHRLRNRKVTTERPPYKGALYNCLSGECKCEKPTDALPLIRGDTKKRTQPPVSLERLELRLRWAESTITSAEEALRKAVKSRDRLKSRVERLQAKQRISA